MPNSPFLADVPAKHYLREWREARGLSQDQLGRLCGTTGATISRYENNDRGLPLELMLKLFEHLDILPGQFFAPVEAPDLNVFAVALTPKDRRALLDTISMVTALTPAERTEVLEAIAATAASRLWKKEPALSPQSPQSTPDETV
jgi:transcriptional regulator with XRE-family HTH domain